MVTGDASAGLRVAARRLGPAERSEWEEENGMGPNPGPRPHGLGVYFTSDPHAL